MERAGSPASGLLAGALALVHEWAPAPRGVLLGGSHATGQAVWVKVDGRPVTLSDLDLYVVVGSRAASGAAGRRARASLRDLGRRALALGLAAPLEAGFCTRDELSALPARPGTIELRRSGRVIEGDPRLLEAVPAWTARDVSDEEASLLLENRGCELLWSWPLLGAAGRLDRLRGRHAVLKCALDLASVASLASGELPDGSEARVAWARSHRAAEGPDLHAACDGLWDRALAWRAGRIEALEPAAAREEWAEAAAAWRLAWTARFAGPAATRALEPLALDAGRRARLRRRLRQAITFRGRGGETPGLGARIAHAIDGTPQHRVNASAALLLDAAVGPGRGPDRPLPEPTARALERLGVAVGAASSGWERSRAEVVRAWDRWLLDGQRTAEPA
jgi:hypothetical protein